MEKSKEKGLPHGNPFGDRVDPLGSHFTHQLGDESGLFFLGHRAEVFLGYLFGSLLLGRSGLLPCVGIGGNSIDNFKGILGDPGGEEELTEVADRLYLADLYALLRGVTSHGDHKGKQVGFIAGNAAVDKKGFMVGQELGDRQGTLNDVDQIQVGGEGGFFPSGFGVASGTGEGLGGGGGVRGVGGHSGTFLLGLWPIYSLFGG